MTSRFFVVKGRVAHGRRRPQVEDHPSAKLPTGNLALLTAGVDRFRTQGFDV